MVRCHLHAYLTLLGTINSCRVDKLSVLVPQYYGVVVIHTTPGRLIPRQKDECIHLSGSKHNNRSNITERIEGSVLM